jgi:hypothetical protein
MKNLTNYEKLVANGRLEPLTGLDAAFICDFVDSVTIANMLHEGDRQFITDIWNEIEFLYKDDIETLTALKTLIGIL